jgi:Gpi18-like mannosyltransferase
MKPRNLTIILLAALLAAVAALELYLIRYQTNLSFDGYSYIAYYPGSTFPPGYPAAIWLARRIVQDGELAARLVSISAHLASILLVYFVTRTRTSNGWSLVAATLYGFNPLALRMGLDTMSESLYVALMLAMLLAVLSNKYLAAGLLGGLAYITRPEAAVVVAALAAVFALSGRVRHEQS